jgi:hypothetical protein
VLKNYTWEEWGQVGGTKLAEDRLEYLLFLKRAYSGVPAGSVVCITAMMHSRAAALLRSLCHYHDCAIPHSFR